MRAFSNKGIFTDLNRPSTKSGMLVAKIFDILKKFNLEIGQNRKKGRPNKTKKALIVQNENNSSDSSRSSKSDTESKSTDSSVLIQRAKKRNPRQIKSNENDTLNDADNLENFEDTCINTAIDTISATIASTSKNGNSDGMYDEDNQKYLKTFNKDNVLKSSIAKIMHWADHMSTVIESQENTY